MAEITSFTAERIQAIEDAEIVDANIDGSGHLTLTRKDDGVIDGGSAASAPTGSIIMFAGDTAPSGWLLCNGQAVSRSTYLALFTAIGSLYGGGDGSSTFNVPNLESRFPRMNSASLASSGGAASHTHTIADHTHVVPDHAHQLDGAANPAFAKISLRGGSAPNIHIDRLTVPNWTCNLSGDVTTVADNSSSNIAGGAKVVGDTQLAGNDASAAGNDTDSSASLPPYLDLNFIIKT
jgi:microcystin-dependent protein